MFSPVLSLACGLLLMLDVLCMELSCGKDSVVVVTLLLDVLCVELSCGKGVVDDAGVQGVLLPRWVKLFCGKGAVVVDVTAVVAIMVDVLCVLPPL